MAGAVAGAVADGSAPAWTSAAGDDRDRVTVVTAATATSTRASMTAMRRRADQRRAWRPGRERGPVLVSMRILTRLVAAYDRTHRGRRIPFPSGRTYR
ncbi:hypothetical protein Cs7R123_09650 [Catellatospora sp. TT07R-123]|nr:hypothetical protein Cs7R123_09650 [Catellatospora sp. TT07R-123]